MGRAVVHAFEPGQAPEGAAGEVDGYLDKLAKYIPGEVLAGFVGLAALASAAADAIVAENVAPRWPVAIVAVAGLVATPGYLYFQSERRPDEITYWYTYLIAAVAFVPWAIVASEVIREWIGWPTAVAEFAMALTAFMIPLLDSLLGKFFGRR